MKQFFTYAVATILSIAGTKCVNSSPGSQEPQGSESDNLNQPLFENGDKQNTVMKGVSPEELEQYRVKWNSSRPRNFSYNLKVVGFSPLRGSYKFSISADSGASVVSADGIPAPDDVPDIQGLFDKIARTSNDNRVECLVRFDQTYGYPAAISLRWGESLAYEITSFTVD